jgi:pilus assembly protein CpaD
MRAQYLAPLLATLALAACQAPSMDAGDIPPPDKMSALHVERVRVQYDAAFAPGSSELPANEALRLETFVDQSGLRPSDRAFVASASGDPLAAARLGRLSALLARRGIGTAPVGPPPSGVAPNHVVLMVDRYVVTPPRCPDWSGSPATGHDNVPNGNFGCATANNFALMVDNPRDLIAGRALGPADAEPSLNAITRYRTEQVKPLLGGQTGGAGGAAGAPGPQPGMSSGTSGGGSTGQ